MILCNNCHSMVEKTSKFCKHCGESIKLASLDYFKMGTKKVTERVCRNCHTPLDTNSLYCTKCGGKAVEKSETKSAYDANIPMDNMFKDKKPKSIIEYIGFKTVKSDFSTAAKVKNIIRITIVAFIILILLGMVLNYFDPVEKCIRDNVNYTHIIGPNGATDAELKSTFRIFCENQFGK